MKFSLKTLFLFIAFAAFIVWFLHTAYVGLTHVETGENVAYVEWLPEAASNVSFYKSYSFTAFEFDISESEFVKWSRWKLSQVDGAVRITRYCYGNAVYPGPNATADEWQAYELAEAAESATITNGLYFGHTQTNGGGVWVAYDRNSGRAYYESAPR